MAARMATPRRRAFLRATERAGTMPAAKWPSVSAGSAARMARTLKRGRRYMVPVPILYGVTGLAMPRKFTRRRAGGYLGVWAVTLPWPRWTRPRANITANHAVFFRVAERAGTMPAAKWILASARS